MKKILISALISASILGLCSALYVNAMQGKAERFSPDAEKIQEFFGKEKKEIDQDFKSRFRERAIDNCEISEEQKELFSANRETKRDLLKGLSPEEKILKIEEIRQEMSLWAEENGIECSREMKGPFLRSKQKELNNYLQK